MLLVGLPWYFISHGLPSLSLSLWTVCFLYISGLGITALYHRFYSHKTYKLNKWVEGFLLFFATIATQGSALRWSFDHRLHHAHIDGEEDPYTVNDGFWHAHILWMFKKGIPIKDSVVSDLLKNKLVVLQHKFYVPLMVLSNALVFGFLGWITQDYAGAFIIGIVLRMFLLHHFTWCINSLAHYWGEKNYSSEHSAVDNYAISLLTFGEGYHNYHHTYASDYRNGIKWYHYDPTKWLIWILNKLGLAKQLRKIPDPSIHKKMLEYHEMKLVEHLSKSAYEKKEALIHSFKEVTSSLKEKLFTFYQTSKDQPLYKQLKSSIKSEWNLLRRMSKTAFKVK